ncbi:hypothetical protein FGIG_00117 [Fasciola gigantica]|uniref:SAM domain-containing protein n=1 Tax=Fasciola gigantica TaxID=46835 RepID=A0A504YT35_FASGI|nr:hypothetical protein FGIG_00117 [Fasciola gigantica]
MNRQVSLLDDDDHLEQHSAKLAVRFMRTLMAAPNLAGAPGIVLHATGPVPGNPGFPGSNQLLPGLPAVGNTHGLGGTTTFNFLQPHQPFSTTLLPQATHGADYLFDLGLSQTPFPPSSNSITLFNSVESIGAGPLSHTATIYPVIQPPGPGPQPHSQSLFPTSCALNASISGPLFVSPPSYRPSMGGVTNLVSSTTPQMATSLGSGSGSFGPANLSSLGGSAAHGGFLFQTTNSHPQPSTQLIPPCGPLIQSAQVKVVLSRPLFSGYLPFHQFSSYPMAFQGADSCLPVAPTLTSTLPGFRHSEPQMETSVSSANMNSTPGLPQLWASSTPVSSFSPIPICPSSLPQPTTFPITVNANSAVLAPVVATVATPLSSSSPTAATSTILPHPPALQPCPALTKRFQRLCPLPSGRTPASVGPGLFSSSPTKRNPGLALRPPGSSTTLTTSAVYGNEKRTVPSGFSTAIRSRQPIGPLTANKASIASASLAGLSSASSNPLGATMTIRTPNSVTVIPAARRRRPLARATPSLKAADKTVNQQSVEVSCITPTISTNCTQSTTTPITTTTTTTTAGTTTTTKTTASTTTCVSASPPLITSDTPTTAESIPSDTSQGTDGKLKQTNPLVAGVSDSVPSGTQSQASSMKPVSSVSQLPITVNTSVASDTNLFKNVSNPTSNDTRSRSAVADRTAVPVSSPTQAVEPQITNLTEKSESHARSSVNTNHNPHLEADTLQSNVLCIPTLPQNKTTPNSPTTNLSPPQNRSRRYSGSRSIMKQTSQRAEPSSVSPGHLSFSPKGTPHTDSFELQASLERLGVSGNQTRKMSTPSATVTTTTVRTTRSHQSSLRTTGQLTVVHTSPVKMMPTALPAPLLPPPLLHRGPDDRRILTHFIDGHVIYESNKPFPVKHGMSVVEAALLQQCITEEQEEDDAMRYSVNTTDGLHRPRRSSSSSSGVAFDAPVPSPVNGEQPMQLDDEFSQADRVADEKESNLCAVQPAPKRLSYASLPEHESPQYKLSSGQSTPHNGYTIQQSGHSLRGSKDTVSVSVESHAELSNHFADRSDQDTASRVKSPMLGGSDLATTTITTAGSTTSSALASGLCPTQRSQQSIYVRMPPAACTSHRPHEACSDMQPTLPARSPVLSVSQTSSPSQTPYTIQHGVQSVGPTSHQFPGLFTHPHPHPVPQLPEPPPPGPVRFWSADDVVTFVRGTPGCGAYAEAFHANEIDGEALLLLAEDQFIQPPIGMKIGPALKLAARLETLRNTS